MKPMNILAGRSLRATSLALVLAAGVWLGIPSVSWSQEGNGYESTTFEKTNPRMLAAFRQVVADPVRSTVRVRCDGRDAALGTVVGPDGWILTKASELTGKLTIKLPSGRVVSARVIGTHEKNDLALLKIEARNLRPVLWVESGTAPVGNWVAAAGTGRDPVAVGVVGVAARTLKDEGNPFAVDPTRGYLGVMLDSKDDLVKIGGISSDAPAAKAGLEVNDVLLTVGSTTIKNMASLVAALKDTKPGDVVRIRIKRDGTEKDYKVTLGKRPEDRADFQDRLGSELSRRRRGFPAVLQHDLILKPSDCGGPLVDLDGNVIGINIARAGRTETYALPSEAVLPLLRDLSAGKLNIALVKKKDEAHSQPETKGLGKTSTPRFGSE